LRIADSQTPAGPVPPERSALQSAIRNPQSAIKISDFGLAKDLDAAGRTASNAIVGTPSYMAPEQAASRHQQIGPATDVYALGAILYELLTGRPPFRAATSLETALQVISDEPVPPAQLQPKTQPNLERICLKCLEKEPGKRYASARELADDLGRFQRGESVRARPLGRLARGWRWCKRNPVVAGLMAAVAVTLVLGTRVASWLAIRAEANAQQAGKQEALAEERAVEAQGNEQWALQEKAKADAPRKEAEEEKQRAERQRDRAEWLVYAWQIGLAQREWQDGNVAHAKDLLDATRWDFRGWEHRYLYTLFNSNQRTFLGHTSWVRSVAFSPDGQRLASGSFDRTVKVWEAVSGQEARTLKGHTGTVRGVAFSPDGSRLLSGSSDQTVKLWYLTKEEEP
jgi:hypothetical protein